MEEKRLVVRKENFFSKIRNFFSFLFKPKNNKSDLNIIESESKSEKNESIETPKRDVKKLKEEYENGKIELSEFAEEELKELDKLLSEEIEELTKLKEDKEYQLAVLKGTVDYF